VFAVNDGIFRVELEAGEGEFFLCAEGAVRISEKICLKKSTD
jgi:hypothetical protein